MQVTVFGLADSVSRARYDALFNACPQAFVQQSTAWAEIIADLGPDEPIFLLASDNGRDVGGMPLYFFQGSAGAILTSVPQPGPLGGIFCCRDIAQDAVYAALIQAAIELATNRECIALSAITNPIEDDIARYRHHLQPSLVFENFTQIVPIGAAVRDGEFYLPNNRERNPGRTIRKAEAAGLTAKLCTDIHEFDAWFAIHVQRHGELGLLPLQRSLLHRIWSELGRQNRAFLQLVMSGDEIAAGCLFIHHRDVCDAYIMSMASKFSNAAPNYLLTKAALMEMEKRGIKFMNWQSSIRRDDGVYKFKKQWGGVDKTYCFVTKIFGDGTAILELGKERARKEYPNHYLIPFAAFEIGTLSGTFSKA